ncbi:MAG: xanthine dehydrogenase family protein molybdopterin-binding subunit [Rhodocyclaceae bacterium]|nr:xanthine dehydrogenase family protein molybdopterin-binding subunit [Rhodocyclaceae bacterium]
MKVSTLARRDFLKGGALLVGFSFSGALPALALAADAAQRPPQRVLDLDEVDAFIAVRADGTVIIYSGKVDLGTGHRIAMRQMVAEELSCPVARIDMIEGDTALTPNQGPTAGSSGVMRGGVQLRQAAATACLALIERAAERYAHPAADLKLEDAYVVSSDGKLRVGMGELVGGRPFGVKMNPKAPLKQAAHYAVVGKDLPRPDLPDKITGRHVFVHDLMLDGMLHGRALRPPAVGASLLSMDLASIAHLRGARVVRIKNFLGVVAADEWTAVRAAAELKTTWSDAGTLVGHDGVRAWARGGPFLRDETLKSRGDTSAVGATALRATYYWPVQSHASMGPSCAVADVRAGQATIWTASQATHRYWPAYAAMLGLPVENVRLIYLDGSGCYGMNGHDDAAADAALLSKAVARPVRVQWTREDELGWDPKGPPQLIDLRAALGEDRNIAAWEAEMWVPIATANLAHVPLLAPGEAGIAQPAGQSVGLIAQNADPPYRCANLKVTAHWLAQAPLRPSNIRAPGKVANNFAVESFVDELAAAAGADPLEFRLRQLADPRGIEVLQRCARRMGWQARPARAPAPARGARARGTGIAYLHYKHNETYVAIAMQVEVDTQNGRIRVERVACAHDCGLMINPDAVRNQVEGNILQTLSRTLIEETRFDRRRVTSVDWQTYPILRYSEVPELLIDLIDRPDQPPLGAGEAACAAVPAALANAVADAAGIRLREVPFTPERVLAALRAA